MPRSTIGLLSFAVSLFVVAAEAQTAPADAGKPGGKAPPTSLANGDEPRKEEARSEFEKAVALFDQGAWEPALAGFRKSIQLYPTRAALVNVAACLRKLRRLDEALDVLESLSREFPEPLRVQSGHLKVIEQSGRTLDVVVDSAVVGKTPWEGPVSVGDHSVLLRGEGQLGTQPASASVQENQITALTLFAEELDATVRVEPVPAGAGVTLDGVAVGRGVWEGHLRAGAHRIEVAADGFLTATRQVRISHGKREVVVAALERDPSTAAWRASHPSRFTFELDGGLALAPSLGGDLAASCAGSCNKATGLGANVVLHGGYQLGSGIGFGVNVGYLTIKQNINAHPATITPHGFAPNAGTADDSLTLGGPLLGVSAGIHLGDELPITMRLTTGLLFGHVTDQRSGHFTSNDRGPESPPSSYAASVSENPGATYLFIAPEARVGARLGDHLEGSIGVQALLLTALKQPTWSDQTEVLGPDGLGGFGSQQLTGSTVLTIVPSAGVRYEF